MQIAVLDDYQGVAQGYADWASLGKDAKLTAFKEPIRGEDALAKQLAPFDVVVGMRERTAFPKGLLNRLPNLKLLITTGMQNASFDMEAATELGIPVAGTGGAAGESTGELTWGIMIALMRGIAFEDAAVKQGAWQTTIGPGLKGKTLGLLGLGRIGGQMAGYAHAFGMPVIAWSQNLTEARAKECGAKLVTKDDLFKLADVISIHLRLSARTTKLVGARELGLMKPTAYLLNSSRGPIVDEAALIDALNKGKIAGAGLDVYDEEPMPKEHPLRKAKNAVLTPHLGYVTQEALRTMYSDAVADIRAAAAGEAIRVLNQDVLKRSNLRKLR
jgi:phosphoglycerate dehydrogenase-like enzyme